jgi:Plasmid pRiA4b ORF-3-like protein
MFRRNRQVYVFRAKLIGHTGVKRRVAVRTDGTLVELHTVLQEAFGWNGDRLYAFWLDGRHWSLDAVEYTAPEQARTRNPRGSLWELPETRSAGERLDVLGLVPGQKIAYAYACDFGDEWRVELTVAEIAADKGGSYPAVLESIGQAPPQVANDRADVA